MIDILSISYRNALRWMLWDPYDNKSTLVQVMTWCSQTANNYLSQCWPTSMTLYCVTSSQWVDQGSHLGSPHNDLPIGLPWGQSAHSSPMMAKYRVPSMNTKTELRPLQWWLILCFLLCLAMDIVVNELHIWPGRYHFQHACVTWLILSLRPANERRCYKVTQSLISWA